MSVYGIDFLMVFLYTIGMEQNEIKTGSEKMNDTKINEMLFALGRRMVEQISSARGEVADAMNSEPISNAEWDAMEKKIIALDAVATAIGGMRESASANFSLDEMDSLDRAAS